MIWFVVYEPGGHIFRVFGGELRHEAEDALHEIQDKFCFSRILLSTVAAETRPKVGDPASTIESKIV